MINSKVVSEIRRAVARNRHEFNDTGGIYIKDIGNAGGLFEVAHLNGDGIWRPDPNLLPTQGLASLLNIGVGPTAKEANWFFAPFAENVAPTSGLTAANFGATQTEFINYTEVTRALWTPAVTVTGTITNAATAVSITIGADAGQVDMYGMALISSSTKGGTSGKLVACTLFKDSEGDPKPRLGLVEGDILGLRYSLTLTSAA